LVDALAQNGATRLPFLIANTTKATPAAAQTTKATTDASAPNFPPVSQSGPIIVDCRKPLLCPPEDRGGIQQRGARVKKVQEPKKRSRDPEREPAPQGFLQGEFTNRTRAGQFAYGSFSMMRT